MIDGIDLATVRVGDTVELKPLQAVLLIREGWAEPLEDEPTPHSTRTPTSTASESRWRRP